MRDDSAEPSAAIAARRSGSRSTEEVSTDWRQARLFGRFVSTASFSGVGLFLRST